jgi:hypothetical protein
LGRGREPEGIRKEIEGSLMGEGKYDQSTLYDSMKMSL